MSFADQYLAYENPGEASIIVRNVSDSEWEAMWRNILEAVEPGSSRHCLFMHHRTERDAGGDFVIEFHVKHPRLGVHIVRIL